MPLPLVRPAVLHRMTSDQASGARALFERSSPRCRFAWTALLLLAFWFVGLCSYRDYGISWDELANRRNGMITLRYLGERFAPGFVAADKELAKFTTPLAEHVDRDYGVAFEVPLALLERLIGLEGTREIYLFRHLVTFFACSLGVLALLRLAERRFDDWRVGLLGALFLILSPRLFADSFYNSKDTLFLALFAIAMNTAVEFLLRPTVRTALWHAVATAVVIDVRVVGILMPAATAGFLLLGLVRAEARARAAAALAVYFAFLAGLVVALWPHLWTAPVANFLHAIGSMSAFRWDKPVLYLGELTPATELPWHYILVWIGISTPILYLFLFGTGVIAILARHVRERRLLWRSAEELQDLLFLALAVGPLLSVILLDSVLYDGWRQLYFVYPALLLVAVRGWVVLRDWRPAALGRKWPVVVGLGTALALAYIAGWMARAHPYQNVYVNALAGKNAKTRFDMDYWGLTNREALQVIVARDERPAIKVWPGSWTPLTFSTLMLEKRDRLRVRVVDDEADADYIVTNYRGNQRDYAAEGAAFEVFHEIIVDGEVVNTTYARVAGK